jgi:hypothetical protein
MIVQPGKNRLQEETFFFGFPPSFGNDLTP